MQETQVQSMCHEDLLENGMATHSSILSWRIPWAEKPGGLYPNERGGGKLHCIPSFRSEMPALPLKRMCMASYPNISRVAIARIAQK